jgi:predicted nucleotidyltransferase
MDNLPISINTKKIVAFCRKHHIAFCALFGSILSSHFSPSSDVDVLVRFEKEHTPNFFDLVDMEFELATIIGRQVDLRTPNELSPYFRDEVLATAKVLYVE